MAQDRNGAVSGFCERLHVHGERVHLNPVNFVAGEGPGQGVDRNVLRLEITRRLKQLLVKAGHLDVAAPRDSTQSSILPQQRENVQTAVTEILERDPVMLRYRGKPNVNFVLIVLGTEIE